MNPEYYPYEVPDFRLKRHHTDELVEISAYVSHISLHIGGNINGIYDPVAMARYMANQLGEG